RMSELQDIREKHAPALSAEPFTINSDEIRKLLAVDPAGAIEKAREMLKATPDDFEARMFLAAALRQDGDAEPSKESLEPLVAPHPESAEVRYQLGLTLGTLGENHAAIAMLTEAVNLDRNMARAWSALGEQYVLIGDVLASDAAYSHHFNVSVSDPQLQKAVTALRNGRPDITEDIVLEYLETHPENVNALKMLAEAAIACDRNEDASSLLERCLELAPDFSAARYRLVSSLYLQNRLH